MPFTIRNPRTNSALVLAALAAVAGGASASDKIIASYELGSVVVPTSTGNTFVIPFSGVNEPVTGVGVSGLFTVQAGDFGDGTGPWSLDAEITATAPDGASAFWHPIGGDFTIADYPLQDGIGDVFAGANGNGDWTFDFTSDVSRSNWTFRIDDAVVYLLADAADVTTTFTAEPDPAQQWNRPFFIAGVSGLGPVAYEAFEFTVSESGLYDFSSVLSSPSDHFTFLYQDSFDPNQPLTNLLDYGLGNGFSPFDVPRGTSAISALLFEGVTYTWVTSQWSSSSTILPATNTIVGPGEINTPSGCTPDTNGDGMLDPSDFTAWINAFNNQLPECDQNDDGSCTPADFTAWINNYNAGC